jgi:O-antigen/teichoic acid export membrane protein
LEKALKMGRSSAAGSFQLFTGTAISTVIMAVGTIILARLLMPDEYGLYSIVLIPSLTISLFRDWGVDSAMTRYIAHLRAANKDEKIRDIITAGVVFEFTTGLAMSFFSLLLAGFIASTVFRRPESASLISIASMAIFSGSLLRASLSSFIGFERMEFNSFTMICQATVKSVLSPLLVFLGFGVLGAVLGYTFSFLVAGVISLLVLYFLLFRNLKRDSHQLRILETLREMLRYGAPLSVSSILEGFFVQFYGFMMAFFSSNILIGNYHAAKNFAVILTFFTFPISTVLFPAFAKLDSRKEQELLKTVFASSVKYTALLLVPATIAVMVLSKPMINSLFGEQYVYAPLFLTLYVIGNLFAVFGSLSMVSFLRGVGETKMLMKLSILTLSCGLPLAFILIPILGIVGVILGNLLAGLPSMIWGLHWIWKQYEAKADFKSSARILIASVIAAVTGYLSISLVDVSDWIELTAGGIIFLAIYIIAATIIGAISHKDIDNLKTVSSGLGFISTLMNIPLVLVEKLQKLIT